MLYYVIYKTHFGVCFNSLVTIYKYTKSSIEKLEAIQKSVVLSDHDYSSSISSILRDIT